MDPITIGLLCIGGLLLLVLLGVPVAVAMFAIGIGGMLTFSGETMTFATLRTLPYALASNYSFAVVPMFILMGALASNAGIINELYSAAYRWMVGLRGSLYIATTLASAAFGAISGSTIVNAVVFTRMALPEMIQFGFNRGVGGGCIAAAGTLAAMIPPSITMVLYGILTGESIGALLIAGIIPGILSALLYGVVVVLRRGTEIDERHTQRFAREFPELVRDQLVTNTRGGLALAQITILFGIVVGGIYSGVFTATESGAIAAFVALIMLLIATIRRREQLSGGLTKALMETAALSSMIFMLLIGGALFSLFVVTGGYAQAFASWVTGLPLPGMLIIALLLLALIPLGMFLDGLSILFLTVPLAYPVVSELGLSGIWFGILMVKMVEIGLITPPVGINVYVVAGAAPGLTIEDAFKGVWPFGLMDAVTVVILFAFPVLVTFLPEGVAG